MKITFKTADGVEHETMSQAEAHVEQQARLAEVIADASQGDAKFTANAVDFVANSKSAKLAAYLVSMQSTSTLIAEVADRLTKAGFAVTATRLKGYVERLSWSNPKAGFDAASMSLPAAE